MEALLESLVAMGFPRSRAEMAISATEGAGVLAHRIRPVTHPNPLHGSSYYKPYLRLYAVAGPQAAVQWLFDNEGRDHSALGPLPAPSFTSRPEEPSRPLQVIIGDLLHSLLLLPVSRSGVLVVACDGVPR